MVFLSIISFLGIYSTSCKKSPTSPAQPTPTPLAYDPGNLIQNMSLYTEGGNINYSFSSGNWLILTESSGWVEFNRSSGDFMDVKQVPILYLVVKTDMESGFYLELENESLNPIVGKTVLPPFLQTPTLLAELYNSAAKIANCTGGIFNAV